CSSALWAARARRTADHRSCRRRTRAPPGGRTDRAGPSGRTRRPGLAAPAPPRAESRAESWAKSQAAAGRGPTRRRRRTLPGKRGTTSWLRPRWRGRFRRGRLALLQHERRGQILGDDRRVRLRIAVGLDGDFAHVDDPVELADPVEKEPEVVIRAFGLDLVRQFRIERLLLRRLRREALNREVRLRREALYPPEDLGDVLLFGQHRLEALEPGLQLVDLGLKLGQPARGREAARDVAPQAGEPALPDLDVGLHVAHVEVPEPEHAQARDQDEGADLRLPRKFAERDVHVVSLPARSTSSPERARAAPPVPRGC